MDNKEITIELWKLIEQLDRMNGEFNFTLNKIEDSRTFETVLPIQRAISDAFITVAGVRGKLVSLGYAK